ncbi:MAG: aspartate dehydrogenase [Paenibacillaceae bacterium]
MLKVGIIGYGTIGKDVAEAIHLGKAGTAKVTSILVRDVSRFNGDTNAHILTDKPDNFFAEQLDVVVECAGHESVKSYGVRAIDRGADLLVVSVGAFADDALLKQILDKANTHHKKVIIPSAAVGGLDRIAAGSIGLMEEVTLITRKPPAAWYGTFVEEQVDLAKLTESYCVFEGVARDSARIFPESVNVSAALSLAGIGFDATKVKVFVDPSIKYNIHEIEARGKFGQIQLSIRNTPTAGNPKTGYIVAMSVIKNLRDLTAPFIIGT